MNRTASYSAQILVIVAVLTASTAWMRHSERGVSAQDSPKIVLSEVMFDPIGSEYYDEFVEIYNLSPADTVDLTGWEVGDGEGWDALVPAGKGLRLAPGQYGLILDSGYFSHSTTYDSLIPDAALVLTIAGATFGRNGLSNSVPKTVMLRDSSGKIVAAYTYSLGNPPGHSDEKIDLNGGDSPDNWANSLRLNGTPGFRNSVSPLERDLKIELSSAKTTLASPDVFWSATVAVRNVGLRALEVVQLNVWATSFGTEDSLLLWRWQGSRSLSRGEVWSNPLDFRFPHGGRWNIRAELTAPQDKNPANNFTEAHVRVGFPPGTVVINEVMYYPEIGKPEWLELYSTDSGAVDLGAWSVALEEDTSRAVSLGTARLPIPRRGYAVVSRDSAFLQTVPGKGVFVPELPALRNTGSEIFLFDLVGNLIDAAQYRPEWGRKRGFSLERVWYERSGMDSSNWRLSEVKGGTPGRRNSVSPLTVDLSVADFWLEPNPSPAGQEVTARMVLVNAGRTEISEISWAVFEDLDSDSTWDASEPRWDSPGWTGILSPEDTLVRQIEMGILQPGTHALQAEAEVAGDLNPANNRRRLLLQVGYPAGTVVINEIMFRPRGEAPEWLELWNTSEMDVELSGWRLLRRSTGSPEIITENSAVLRAGEFCLISADTLAETPLSVLQLVPRRFPPLPNAGDSLLLQDYSGTTVDSVSWRGRWSEFSGVSLERINPALSGTDSSNWAPSADPSGATPGRRNSVFTEIVPSNAVLDISPNPFSPDGDGFEDVAIIQYRLPFAPARVRLQVFDLGGRLVCDLLNNAPSGSERRLIWNGRKNNGEKLHIGIYILYLEAVQEETGRIVQMKKPVVLARKL